MYTPKQALRRLEVREGRDISYPMFHEIVEKVALEMGTTFGFDYVREIMSGRYFRKGWTVRGKRRIALAKALGVNVDDIKWS